MAIATQQDLVLEGNVFEAVPGVRHEWSESSGCGIPRNCGDLAWADAHNVNRITSKGTYSYCAFCRNPKCYTCDECLLTADVVVKWTSPAVGVPCKPVRARICSASPSAVASRPR